MNLDYLHNITETIRLFAQADLLRYTVRIYEDLSAVLILIGA